MRTRALVFICLAASLIALWGSAVPLMSAPARMWAIAYFPDGKRLATTNSGGFLQIWSADGEKLLESIQVSNTSLNGVAISPDGKRLATASSDKSIQIWDTEAWREINRLLGHMGPVLSVAFSPDGRRLASTSVDKTVRLWEAVSGTELAVLRGHTARVTKVAFSPDGALLASIADDATPRIWDVATGDMVATFELPDTKEIAKAAVAFTRDSCCLLVSDHFNAYAWDIKSRTLKFKLDAHAEAGLAVLPDGKRIVGAAQSTVFLYDAATGKLQSSYSPSGIEGPDGRYPHEFGDILALALSPNGESFALASAWGGIHVATIGAIDVQQARVDAEYDEPRDPLCVGDPCAEVKWVSQDGCVALTNSTVKIMRVDAAFLGGGRHKFAILPGETRQLQIMIGCVKLMGALKSVDITYITESELPKAPRRSEEESNRPQPSQGPDKRAKPLSSSSETFPPAKADVESKPKTTAIAGSPIEEEWKICSSSSYGDSGKAIEACTKLIARGEEIPVSRRAEVFLKRGQLEEGLLSLKSPDKTVQAKILDDYNAAIDLDQSRPLAYLARALLTVNMGGDRDRAIADLSEVIRLDPGISQAYHVRGRQYAKKGDLDRALIDVTKSIELAPDSLAYEFRAELYEKKDQLVAAFKDFEAAAGLAPKNSFSAELLQQARDRVGRPLAKYHADRGQLAAQNGDTDLAILDFNSALEYDPRNWRANLGRGGIYLQRGDLSKAGADIRTAIQEFSLARPGDWPPEIVTAQVTLGEIYEKRREFGAALFAYQEALKANRTPSDAENIKARIDRIRSLYK